MDGLNLNNQLDEKTQLLISKMEKEIELKDSEIQNLKTELAFLKGQILSKNRKIFGKSSEQVDSNQISIFDDAEKNSDSKVVEPTIEEIVYTKTKSSKHTGKKDNLANLERIIVEHKLEENEAICSKCNNPLVVIGRKSKEVLKYIPAKLYKIEKDLREIYSKDDDYYKKRYKIRLEKSAPILNEFQEYVEREIKYALPKSPLGKALDYTRKLLPDMKTLLEYGSLEIDNNGAERAIKPFVIGRKNWLFSNTAKGAKSSALIYSIIETAKANGLIVEKYLVYLFDVLANAEYKDKEILDNYMPWSKALPDVLRIKVGK